MQLCFVIPAQIPPLFRSGRVERLLVPARAGPGQEKRTAAVLPLSCECTVLVRPRLRKARMQ
jgi:hypothetical protein